MMFNFSLVKATLYIIFKFRIFEWKMIIFRFLYDLLIFD